MHIYPCNSFPPHRIFQPLLMGYISNICFIPSNHILKASAVVVAIVAQIVMGAVISTFCSKLFPPPIGFSVLLPLALQLIKSVFMVTIVISHDGVRGHMSNLYFIRRFTSLLSMRQFRQISADKSNVELHGVTALK